MGNDFRILATLCAYAFLNGCATGTAMVTGQERSPIDKGAVTLYLQAPAHYDVVGIVEASSNVGFSAKAAQDRAISELKKQAAMIGANGVIDWKVSDVINLVPAHDVLTGGSSPHLVRTKTVRGTAVYVTSIGRSE